MSKPPEPEPSSAPAELAESAQPASDASAGPSARSVAAVGLLTLFSRLTGLLRVATFAHFLGVGLRADAFQVAFLLPNVLRRLVGEGAIAGAVVPVYARWVQREDAAEQRLFAEKFLSLWLVLVGAVTVAGVILAGWLVSLGFRWGSFKNPAKAELTVELTRILFWYLLLIGMAAALQGLLNARKVFALPALSPLLFNLIIVGFAWLVAAPMAPQHQVYALCAGVLLGGLLQLALMLPPIWRLGIRPRWRWPLGHPGVRQILSLLVPAVLGAGVYQINVVISAAIAARLEEGSVAALGYSNRLMEVVLGVFVIALSTVSLTSLSHQAAVKDFRAFNSTVLQLLRLVLFITVPSAVGLFLLREPITSLLLEGGMFDAKAREMTARAFQFHVLGLCFVGLCRGLVSGFHALKDVATPVRLAALNMVLNIVLAWWLSAGPLSFAGVALASSLAAGAHVLFLGAALKRKLEDLRLRELAAPTSKTVVAATIMGFLVYYGRDLLPLDGGKLVLGAVLLALILAGAALFFSLAALLGMPEARWLLRLAAKLVRLQKGMK